MRLAHSWFDLTFYYENVQQGNVTNTPYSPGAYTQFLHNDIDRFEIFKTVLDLRLTKELSFDVNYQLKKHLDDEIHYLYTGAEFKY